MKKGDIVKLNVPCMGNPIGSYGVVYEEYEDFDDDDFAAVSVILPNGEYCGFSVDEQNDFFELCGFDEKISKYQFTHVIQLGRDFNAGMFDSALK
jgi:hypothetical protein